MYKVLTTKGIKPVSDIIFGDIIYEYKTNRLLLVKGVSSCECDKLIDIEYNDGRHQMFYCNENVLINHKDIIQACKLINNIPNNEINTYPQIFDGIYNTLDPDPYIASALLGYGDYEDEYINYPLKRVEANCTFSHKYNVDYFPIIKDGKVYFQWKGKDTDKRITWKEFFPTSRFYAKTKSVKDPAFPYEYMFSSFNNRIQFIRGLFDMGYDMDLIYDHSSIIHWSKDRLKWFQWIMWSLGMTSIIQEYKDKYLLRGIRWTSKYPGNFYWIDYIKNMIYETNVISYINGTFPSYEYPYNLRTKLKIKKVTELNTPEVSYQIITDKPRSIFISDNFLPRVSI